jgi:hypothetical protein
VSCRANSCASCPARARYAGCARMRSTASRTCSGVGLSVARFIPQPVQVMRAATSGLSSPLPATTRHAEG